MRAQKRLAESKEIAFLREENEKLRSEIEKWKELLLIRQIRNGRQVFFNSSPSKCVKVCLCANSRLNFD